VNKEREVICGTNAAVHCCECQQPIISGEEFVGFKVPGKDSYQFFHYRVRADDCWERHLKQRNQGFGQSQDSEEVGSMIVDETASPSAKRDAYVRTESLRQF